MGDVDPAFIQPAQHRPKLSFTEAHGIPLIDLNSSSYAAMGDLVAEIGAACKNWGFFQVINHGVPPETRRKLEEAARRFFAQPPEEKRKVKRDEVNPQGYYDTEQTKNVRDWKEVLDLTVKNPTILPASLDPADGELLQLVNRWPENLPELRPLVTREAFEEYAGELEKLSHKLLRLISLSLGLQENRLSGFFNDHTSFIRLNHYPPCPIPHLALGVGSHKDSSALTVLAQDEVGGLEVKRKADGEWVRVRPTPEAFIINVGSITQVWSNDEYKSVEHRVIVNSEKERFSIPFFFNPDHSVMVEPLKELVTEQSPAKYRPYNWGKFHANRKLSNFKNLGVDNIQIDDFRLQE
ncbi:protein DMR6-LIKE OXYGENASE 2-like isoform X1 [Diospyros lotus]|uniref:protein DMR6-LIKE OXYGENASE 2-like isoform X1 n=1 Tax=Diospyros lotus TaxID=55363 RepID=UPI00224E0D5D|nr:protein DMR6-LIKE OXYGENASE 2-like isoform X1 [Diospyros lotus]